jgi:hypothetical protein
MCPIREDVTMSIPKWCLKLNAATAKCPVYERDQGKHLLESWSLKCVYEKDKSCITHLKGCSVIQLI